MYTGTIIDVINEATIKAPDASVAGIHHVINLRDRMQKASGGLTRQQQLNGMRAAAGSDRQKWLDIAKKNASPRMAIDKDKTREALRSKFKLSPRSQGFFG